MSRPAFLSPVADAAPTSESAPLPSGSAIALKVKLAHLADVFQSAAGILRELAEHPFDAGVNPGLMADVNRPARLLSVRDVAERLALTERTVRRLRGRGEIPKGIELGGVLRWRPEEIDAWLAAGGRT